MDDSMDTEPETENTQVFILVGRAFSGADRPPAPGDVDNHGGDDDEAAPINVLLTAADETEAVNKALAALAAEGYGRVELDRIGVVDGEPEDPTFAAAYWNAIDGEVAVIAFHG